MVQKLIFFKTISLLKSKGHEVIPVSTKNKKNFSGENPYFIDYPEFREIPLKHKIQNIKSFFFNKEASKNIGKIETEKLLNIK